MKINTTIDGRNLVQFEANDKNPLSVSFDGKETEIKIIEGAGTNDLLIESNGKKFNVRLLKIDSVLKKVILKVNGDIMEVSQEDEFDVLLKSLGMGAGAVKKVNDMKAPMPGVVIDIKVKPGQTVAKDEGIVVLEAMKMENLLKSPIDGVIKSIEITKGETVEKNKVLVNFE
jgi:acetyl/propionyl-CoA carboxylase alpha subunit